MATNKITKVVITLATTDFTIVIIRKKIVNLKSSTISALKAIIINGIVLCF